ncbi:MAG: 4-hydroxy-3-methylbut-2-enyl diphosphate reductase [Armatimonadota bacterium]|nr:4-hydroxy-3-methylbut-2-enyl diphosphate reductase [bacterium]
MKVIVADQAGVCFGVKRALDLVNAEAEHGGEIATLGPLIHNPQVVHDLECKGVRVVKRVSEVARGTIVMPSHGVARDVTKSAEAAGLRVVDAACPFVEKVHRRVERLAKDGYVVVVVGDAGHSEVKAIKSAAGDDAVVVSSPEDVESVDWSGKKAGIVSQTTQTPWRFGEIVGMIAARAMEVVAYNTICYATHDRQSAARALAPKVEAMFVVGGRNSANTNRLAEICSEEGVPTYHIETAAEVQPGWVVGMQVVGLTAGASTPEWIIEEVKMQLERM